MNGKGKVLCPEVERPYNVIIKMFIHKNTLPKILFFLGAPARKLAVGLSAHSPRAEAVGSIVAVSSSSVALPLLLPIRPPPLRAIRYNPWREVRVD